MDSEEEPFRRLGIDPGTLRHEAQSKPDAAAEARAAKQRRIQQAMLDQARQPMSVNQVNIHGATNVRRGVLDSILGPLTGSTAGARAPETLGEVTDRLQQVVLRLNSLRIFKPDSPQVYLAKSDPTDTSSTANSINVDIKVQEASRFKFQTGTDLMNSEGSAFGTLTYGNVFGGGEILQLDAKAGTRTRSAYSANLSAPLLSKPFSRISAEVLASAVDMPWASHEHVLKGGSLEYNWLSGGTIEGFPVPPDQHTLSYIGHWRQITGLRPGGSPTVRADAGDSVKSAIKHTFQRERRVSAISPLLPESGHMVRTDFELAGVGPLGGDVAFSKADVAFQSAFPIRLPRSRHVTLTWGANLGMIAPLPLGLNPGNSIQPTRINDRYLLGGPYAVRGFTTSGIGPHDKGDAVGGDVFAAGDLGLLFPLPFAHPLSAFRGHLFVNSGRLVAMAREPGQKLADLKRGGLSASAVSKGMLGAWGNVFGGGLPSTSAGFGLVYAQPEMRMEMNFCVPLYQRRGELAQKGLQFAVSVHYR